MGIESAYRAAKEKGGYFVLDDWDLLCVSGEDRVTFLHNMTTLNVRELPMGGAAYGLILNDRGKIQADFWLYRADSFIWLLFQPLLGKKARGILERYIIMENVSIEEVTPGWSLFLLMGSAAKLAMEIKLEEGCLKFWGRGVAPRNLYCAIPKNQRGFFAEKLLALNIPSLPNSLYEILRIESGIPRYGVDFDESNIPWEARLDEAIHLGKGCYLGQEIVERVFSRGGIKKELVRFQLQGEGPLLAGTQLFSNDHEVGAVTSSALLPGSQNVIGLAYVQKKDLGEQTPFHLENGKEGILQKL